MKPTDSRSAHRLKRIRELLQAADLSLVQIEAGIVIKHGCAKPYTDYLLAEGEIHIIDWVRNNGRGPYTPILRFGPGKNKCKPEWITSAEKKKRERKRLLSDADKYARHLSAERVRAKINRLRGKPQPWFAALMVAA